MKLKSLARIVFVLAIALAAYLALWPVPIEPQSWDAPETAGYVGDFVPNERLAGLELMDIGPVHGPEDAAARAEGGALYLYVSSQSQTGMIQRVNAATGAYEAFAKTGGRPLGLEFDKGGNLIVADAYKGLLSITPDGQVSVLTNVVDGSPILYADDLDIGDDGVIYFSDASTKHGAQAAGSTMAASLLEIMEHGRTGRLLAYDPDTGQTRTVYDGLSFANGVAMSADGRFVLVNETGEYRVLRIWIKGERQGKMDVIIDNLPGFPDNINRAPDGNFYIGLVSQRLPAMDKLSGKPGLRKIAWRLPEALKPKAKNYGFVLQMDGDGQIIQTWQDPAGSYPLTTGAVNPGDGYLYITSLGAGKLGRMRLEP